MLIYKYKNNSSNISPIDDIQNMKTPAIFLHGKKDRIVPFYHSKELYQVFIKCVFEI